jgi:hypothetical protein
MSSRTVERVLRRPHHFSKDENSDEIFMIFTLRELARRDRRDCARLRIPASRPGQQGDSSPRITGSLTG